MPLGNKKRLIRGCLHGAHITHSGIILSILTQQALLYRMLHVMMSVNAQIKLAATVATTVPTSNSK